MAQTSQIAETFISLIDEAFKQHRWWRQHQDGIAYGHWAQDFSVKVNFSI
ncbi:hypothetical protein [Euhalothece natronophila]|nr:hypothetical protein [Euhalothece natronophila]